MDLLLLPIRLPRHNSVWWLCRYWFLILLWCWWICQQELALCWFLWHFEMLFFCVHCLLITRYHFHRIVEQIGLLVLSQIIVPMVSVVALLCTTIISALTLQAFMGNILWLSLMFHDIVQSCVVVCGWVHFGWGGEFMEGYPLMWFRLRGCLIDSFGVWRLLLWLNLSG